MSKEPKLAAVNDASNKSDKSLRKLESLRKLWVKYLHLHPPSPFISLAVMENHKIPATDCASVKWG